MSRLSDIVSLSKSRWTLFTKSQKINLIAVIALLLVLPTTVGGVLTVQSLRSKAAFQPITPPTDTSITVISPNGGEILKPNQAFTIKWTSKNIDQIAIDMIDIDGKFSTIALPMSASLGEFNWTTPPTWYGSSNQFKIRVYEYPSNSVIDTSDNYFNISYTNSGPTATPITNYPNLVVENINLNKVYPPALPCVGYMITVTVKNIGNAPAQTSRLLTTLYPAQTQALGDKCDSSTTYSQSDAPIPQAAGQTLLYPGQSENYTNYFNPSSYNNVTITSYVDFYKQVIESSEDDNSKSFTFPVEKVFPVSTATPTATPKITPTAYPSVSPTSTPTPQVTSTPIANSAPIITTTSIPNGKVGSRYTATISGYDLDKNDSLSFNSTGFPTEVNNVDCQTSIQSDRKVTSCTYSGTPRKPGIYRIKTTINDQKGGSVSKIFFMYISFKIF